MGLFSKKDQVNFFTLLINQAAVTVEGMKALLDFCENPSKEAGEFVVDMEHKADLSRRLLISEINKTFVTPIDREDLFAFSGAIDDIVDDARTTVEELHVYNVAPDDHIRKMCSVLYEMAIMLHNATLHLEKNKDIAADEAIKAKKMENTVNDLYHLAQADLFNHDDFKYILKYREVYRHLNRASDKGDNAADILLGIIMKM